ncbi:MAG TPA: hypothetical protein VHX60_05950 [Acidobacteriaceae bacterium]|jgi:hypothetical protein|nr:hypothetical protein [Acidobacteriaceae bacterium]
MKRAAVIAIVGMGMATAGPLWCAKAPQTPAEPQPAMRIEVAPLGYMPPSGFYLTYKLSSASLGFFDNDHLLFTFRVGGLLKRLPGGAADDDDQQIRAVVLDLRTGKVVRQTEWRMHDRNQYLWPFTDGNFLVRVRDTLYLTGPSLALRTYFSSDTPLETVELSPDRRTMVIEKDDPQKSSGPTLGDAPLEKTPVQVEIVPAGSKEATVIQDAESPVRVPLLGAGIADVLEGRTEGSWAVREVPLQGQSKILAEVKSNCRPTVEPVSATVALVEGCYQADEDRPVIAISTDGRELWREQWENKYVWGWFTSAQNGSRFVYESVEVTRPISVFDALDESDISQQLAGVYDTESGKLILVRDANPVLTGGQNVALSPDGRRFAVLRRGALEIYDLPPVSAPPPQPASANQPKTPKAK